MKVKLKYKKVVEVNEVIDLDQSQFDGLTKSNDTFFQIERLVKVKNLDYLDESLEVTFERDGETITTTY